MEKPVVHNRFDVGSNPTASTILTKDLDNGISFGYNISISHRWCDHIYFY